MTYGPDLFKIINNNDDSVIRVWKPNCLSFEII